MNNTIEEGYKMIKVLIIGGSDAGISATLRAREVDPEVDVTVVVADRFPNFSICGLPFFLSGEVENWESLAHRTSEQIIAEGINLLLEHNASAIDPARKTVRIEDNRGTTQQFEYDRLVIATGAVPLKPPIEGLDLSGVFLLRWMEDGFAVKKYLDERAPESIVLVGGGYIGLEVADAMIQRDLEVTVIEHADTVLNNVDPSFGRLIGEKLRNRGVNVILGVSVEEIAQEEARFSVRCSQGFETKGDMVLVATGSRPMTDLAEGTILAKGSNGALWVNLRMETNIPDVYAAGDCVEAWHRVLGENTYLPLGSTAHKQGRVAGENAAGGCREYQGTLGTQVVKIFDYVVARTGLNEHESSLAGFDPAAVAIETWDHKHYYPGAQKMHLRILGDKKTRRLLGAQILGHHNSEVAKRIDVLATALYHGMCIDELSDIDLSYTPPLSSPWDPVQMCAQAWCKSQQVT